MASYYQNPEPQISTLEVVDIRDTRRGRRRNARNNADVTLTYNPTAGQFPSFLVDFTPDLKDFNLLHASLNPSHRLSCTKWKDNKHSDHRTV